MQKVMEREEHLRIYVCKCLAPRRYCHRLVMHKETLETFMSNKPGGKGEVMLFKKSAFKTEGITDNQCEKRTWKIFKRNLTRKEIIYMTEEVSEKKSELHIDKLESHAYKSKSLNMLDKAVEKSTSIQHLKKSLSFITQTKVYRNKTKPLDICIR